MDFLFGRTKKKHKTRSKPKRRYRSKSPLCDRKSKKSCPIGNGCSWTSGDRFFGCHAPFGVGSMIASSSLPLVNQQIEQTAENAASMAQAAGATVPQQATIAAAAAADAAAINAQSVGATPDQTNQAVQTAAVQAATAVAEKSGEGNVQKIVAEAVAPIQDAAQMFQSEFKGMLAKRRAMPGNRSAASAVAPERFQDQFNEMLAKRRAMPGNEFGRRRKVTRRMYGFGSMCSDTFKDIDSCLNHNVNGMYPCNWSGGQNSRCQSRSGGPVPYEYASKNGKYASHVRAVVPGLANLPPPPPPPAPIAPVAVAAAAAQVPGPAPFAPRPMVPPPPPPPGLLAGLNAGAPVYNPARGLYTCVGRDISTCGSNPNCQWQAGANPPRCIRRVGHLQGTQYQGPMLPSGFGKKRRRNARKGCKSKTSNKKLPAKIRKLCKKLKIKTTKKVGKRRVCKSLKVILKQIAKKLKKRKSRKTISRRRR
jgi:hypothetical protein